jgi:hypothetical protein
VGRWRSPGILWLTCGLLAVPLLVDCVLFPKVVPFAYTAADVFYYLSVARNVVEHGSFSSDGIHPTNGYQPLWQLLVVALYAACRALGWAAHSTMAVLLGSLVAAVGGIWLVGRALSGATGRVPIVFVGVPFGVYPLASLYYWSSAKDRLVFEGGREGPPPLLGTLYSFVNGMESGLVIFAFGVVAGVFVRYAGSRTLGAGAASGASLAFLSLSRLDHAAFALLPSALWLAELLRSSERRRFALAALGALWLPIAVYLAINHFAIGEALPVSGLFKTTFPIPQGSIAAPALDMLRFPLVSHSLAVVCRVLPIVLSLAWATAFLFLTLRIRVEPNRIVVEPSRFVANEFDLFLVKMAPGVVLLTAYNLVFVHLYAMGHWYQPISLLFMSLTLVSLAGIAGDALARRFTHSIRYAADGVLAVALVLLIVVGYRSHHRQLTHHQVYADFHWRTADKVRKAFPRGIPRLFEADDGIVGFSLGVPTMSGSGLMLDAEAARAARAGHLFEVGFGRGFSVVATLVNGGGELPRDCPEAQALAWTSALLQTDLSGYRASVLFADGPFAMVQLSRASESR